MNFAVKFPRTSFALATTCSFLLLLFAGQQRCHGAIHTGFKQLSPAARLQLRAGRLSDADKVTVNSVNILTATAHAASGILCSNKTCTIDQKLKPPRCAQLTLQMSAQNPGGETVWNSAATDPTQTNADFLFSNKLDTTLPLFYALSVDSKANFIFFANFMSKADLLARFFVNVPSPTNICLNNFPPQKTNDMYTANWVSTFTNMRVGMGNEICSPDSQQETLTMTVRVLCTPGTPTTTSTTTTTTTTTTTPGTPKTPATPTTSTTTTTPATTTTTTLKPVSSTPSSSTVTTLSTSVMVAVLIFSVAMKS